MVVDLAQAIKDAQAAGLGTSTGTGAVYTKQEADAAVQSTYQSLLGRNAAGNEYAKAVQIYLGQSKDTQGEGRAQAVMNFVQSMPEFRVRQQDKYLDAIYDAVAADVAKTKGR
jgi:hypothetical protein